MKINPKNFFGRKLDHLPPHFVNVVIEHTHESHIETMCKWIYEHCSGRYSITKDVIFQNDKTKSVDLVGFEEPGDLTLFVLSGKAQQVN
jgi:hypothetical protein